MQHEYVHFACKNMESLADENFFVRDKANAKKMLKKASELIKKAGGTNDFVRKQFKDWIKDQDLSGGEKAYKFIDENGDLYKNFSESNFKRLFLQNVNLSSCQEGGGQFVNLKIL